MSDREWAAREAPRLVEEARAEALAEVRERLRRRMVDALLEAAEAPPPRPARAGTGLWVYGVVAGSGEAPGGTGVDGAPVRAVHAAGLTALVSDVPLEGFGDAELEDVARLEPLARAHQGVLDRALERGGIVPFRLCTLYHGEDSLRRMLEGERAALEATLERVGGAAEWGVKAYLVDVPAPAATGAAPTGTAWLERKRGDRAAADAAEERAATVHAQLAEHAAAAVLSRPQDRRVSGHEGEMLLNAAYLLPRERADEFAGLVARLGAEHEPHGLRLELTGPWAPYHFVSEGG